MIFLDIIKRELQIAMRKRAEILNPLWFFLIVITELKSWRKSIENEV